MLKPKAGDILICKRNTVLSKLIRCFTRSKVSHVAQCVDVYGELYVIDAQKNGVNPRIFDEWMKEFNYSFSIWRPRYEYYRSKSFFKKAFSKVGRTRYAIFSLLVWHPIFIITGRWLGKKDQKKMTCSEYVGFLHGFENYYKLSPQDILDILEKSDKYELIK